MFRDPLIVIHGDMYSTDVLNSYKLYMFKVHRAPEPQD